MFKENKDFYPTPKELLKKLIGSATLGRKVLEPSAGKGDIADILEEEYYIQDIDVIEKDINLSNMLVGKGYTVVGNDFLTYKTYDEYNAIVMNPPFSEGVKHVLKAIKMSEENEVIETTVYAIVNAETLKNPFSNERKELLQKLEDYKAEIEYVENAFSTAERKTDVEVALIRVKVPKKRTKGSTIDEVMSKLKEYVASKQEKEVDSLKNELSTVVEKNELADKIEDILRVVLMYEKTVELLKRRYQAEFEYQEFLIGAEDEIGNISLRYCGGRNTVYDTEFSKEISDIRSVYWEQILRIDKFEKNLTSSAKESFRKNLTDLKKLEINLVNVEFLYGLLQQNSQSIFKESLIDTFKNLTKYHVNEYSKNIHYYNGWKTNDSYKINKKVIVPFYGYMSIYNDNLDYKVLTYLNDMFKGLQLIKPDLDTVIVNVGEREFETTEFSIKQYKKGTVHIVFKDLDLLNKFNFICGQEFNWVPSDGEIKDNEEAKEFVEKEFGNIKKLRG